MNDPSNMHPQRSASLFAEDGSYQPFAVYRLYEEEIRSKEGPGAVVPRMNGKVGGQAKSLIAKFPGAEGREHIRALVRLVVWDWEAIREEIWRGCYAPCPRPRLQEILALSDLLVASLGTGVTTASHRVSAYAERFLRNRGGQGGGLVRAAAAQRAAREEATRGL
ncbi:MAG: hypothetical protein AB7N76_35855 [Planctomycetota bacterium]